MPSSHDFEKIRYLKAGGWSFSYDKDTKYVCAEHPAGGKQSICEVKNRHFADEFGAIIADSLNNVDVLENLKVSTEQWRVEELIDRTRREERKRMWEQINNQIKEGRLAGNGFDKTAERNGLIHAANIIWSFGI